MNTVRSAIALALALTASACSTEYEQMDKLTPGILLEPADTGALVSVPLRPLSDSGLQLTKISEGFVPKLYNDSAGYCTIAYGHLVKKARCDGGEPDEFIPHVSEPRGSELLRRDMARAQQVVMSSVTVPLTDGQYGALCDFVYNVGGSAFRSSTLLQVVQAGEFARVPGQFRRWVNAGGRKWPGLVSRRENEIELFFEGMPIPPPPATGLEVLEPIDIRAGES